MATDKQAYRAIRAGRAEAAIVERRTKELQRREGSGQSPADTSPSASAFARTLASRAAVAVAITLLFGMAGCSAQTRIGYLIPAHSNSDASKGEVVRVAFHPDSGRCREDDASRRVAKRDFGASAAAFGAKLAVDFVSSELEKEAKRYEAQFSGRVLATTNDLREAGDLVIERWVDRRDLTLGDATVPEGVLHQYEGALRETEEVRAAAAVSEKEASKALSRLMPGPDGSVSGPMLAFLFVTRIEPFEKCASGPFKISPKYVWTWKTKAKVVDLSASEAWKVWQWIGAIALKTDEKANVKVDVAIKAVNPDSEKGAIVDVNATSPVVADLEYDLDSPSVHLLSSKSGIWFDVPRYGPKAKDGTVARPPRASIKDPTGVGFVLFDVAVTERDASNVRSVLEDGSKKLQEKRGGIVESVSSLFE